MSDNETPANSTAEEPPEGELLRERIRNNPSPALAWLAVATILILLELSRWVRGFLEVASAGGFVFGGVGSVPGWVGGNVADTLGPAAGAVAAAIVLLVLLFVVAVLVHSLVPLDLADRFDLAVTRRQGLFLGRAALTVALALAAVLVAFTPLGGFVRNEVAFISSILDSVAELPSLTSYEVISNMGHQTADGGWEGTFLGLSPAWAWLVRFTLVWVYAFACLVWLWKGFNVYRTYYRRADWTPTDDTVRRLRSHKWGLFGLFIVFGFFVLGAFAPAVSPVPLEHNVIEPFNSEYEFEYLSDDGEVETTTHGSANINTRSDGTETNVAPLSYDQYDRWAPLGTTPRGQDMLTHLAYGARTSLVVGLTTIGLAASIAIALSLITAYYKGLVDILVVLTSDTIIAIPVLLLVMMLLVLFRGANHPLAAPMDGGLLLALIFAFAYWPGMWRTLRGPSLQVSEEEWVDAAKSFGQRPLVTMRKHMAPYIIGYIMIYASLLLGGVVIAVAALTFLGLGISPPTPEWGRLIDSGQPYIATRSWHVATISGLLITLIVLGFNALGDGIRDAIDPEADIEGGAAASGGGG